MGTETPKTVIITGVTRGLGEALAGRFIALEGYLEMDTWGGPSVDARVRRIHDPLFREYPCL